MCRLVVWKKARAPASKRRLEAGRYQPGMVIAVLEDGQSPGAKVESAEWAELVDLPGVDKMKVRHLLMPMIADIDETKLPRKRATGVDLAALRAISRDKTEADVETSRFTFDHVDDERVIGGSPRVFG